jgi:hypothetical protein
MKDITINGYSIAELKAQRTEIQQGASKFIAEEIAKATALVKEVIDNAGDYAVANQKAAEAGEILEAIELVASVSGVQYYLPYNEPYDGGNALSNDIENVEDADYDVYSNDAVSQLHSLLQEMEGNSYLWNSSSVHC